MLPRLCLMNQDKGNRVRSLTIHFGTLLKLGGRCFVEDKLGLKVVVYKKPFVCAPWQMDTGTKFNMVKYGYIQIYNDALHKNQSARHGLII